MSPSHKSNLSDRIVDMEEGFWRSHDHGTENFSDIYSIRPGRKGFTEKGSMKGAHHPMQSQGDCKDGGVIFIPASLSGDSPKPKMVVSRIHSGRPSLQWILRPRRLIFFFATLSSMGTIILIVLTLLISKDNNPNPTM